MDNNSINLYNFQKEIIRTLKFNNHIIYSDDMGLGKGAVIVNVFDKVLYIGNKTSITSFNQEILKWKPEKKIFNIYRDKILDRRHKYDYYLLSYNKFEGIFDIIKDVDVIVFDEVHNYFKNSRTNTYKTWYEILTKIHKIKLNIKIIFLTATPVVNSMRELENLYKILFVDRYEVYKHFLGDIKKLGIIRRTKDEISKKENLKLPSIEIHTILENPPEEYFKLKKYFYNFKNFFTKEKLFLISPELLNLPILNINNRIQKTLEILDKHKNKKVLIFSQYKKSLYKLAEKLNEKYYYINGEVSIKKRNEIINKFKTDDTRILLATIKTGGESLNLPEVDMVIFLDLWWTWASLIQGINRVHRLNSKKEKVDVFMFYALKTAENIILDKIKKKAELLLEVKKYRREEFI